MIVNNSTLKTKHLFEKHEQLIENNKTVISELEQSIKNKQSELEDLNKQYEEYIKNGEDDKADKLFGEIVKAETDIKMTQKKLSTKRPILEKKEMDNVIEICTRLKDLPGLYKEESDILKNEYIEAKKKLNEIEKRINDINRNYNNEYEDFVDLFDEYHGDYPSVNKDFIELATSRGITKNGGEISLRKSTFARIINLHELNQQIGGIE